MSDGEISTIKIMKCEMSGWSNQETLGRQAVSTQAEPGLLGLTWIRELVEGPGTESTQGTANQGGCLETKVQERSGESKGQNQVLAAFESLAEKPLTLRLPDHLPSIIYTFISDTYFHQEPR